MNFIRIKLQKMDTVTNAKSAKAKRKRKVT